MVVYRASSLGGCLKSQVANRLNYEPLPPSKQMGDLFAEGHRLEEIVYERLAKEHQLHVSQAYKQYEVDLPVTESVLVQGHIDGLIHQVYKPDDRVLEIKSTRNLPEIKTKGWETPGLVQKYKWQVSCYMLALDLELLMVFIDGSVGLDDYERELFFLPQEKPFYSLSDIRARVLTAEHWARKGELPTECDVKNWPCPFVYLHEDEVVEIEDEQIDVLAKQYKEAQRDEKAAKEKTAKTRQAIETEILKRGDNKLKTKGGSRISRYEQNNPPKFDLVKMKEDGVEVDKYKSQGKSWRLRVEIKEENDGESK